MRVTGFLRVELRVALFVAALFALAATVSAIDFAVNSTADDGTPDTAR